MLIAFLLLFQPEPNSAFLLKACSDKLNTYGHNSCIFYVSGFLDGYAVAHAADGEGRQLTCVPERATSYEVAGAVVNFLTGHPEAMRWQPNAVLTKTLMDSYPCAEKR